MSAIKRVLSFQARENNSQPEDEWFGQRLWTLPGAKVASGTVNALAAEDVYAERPMGYHLRDGGRGIKDEMWSDPQQRHRIFEYCPEISLIMDMKLKAERCPNDDEHGHLNR